MTQLTMKKIYKLLSIKLSNFREHDWFKIDLPVYLFPSADNQGNNFDEEVISEICEVRMINNNL